MTDKLHTLLYSIGDSQANGSMRKYGLVQNYKAAPLWSFDLTFKTWAYCENATKIKTNSLRLLGCRKYQCQV